MVSFSCAACGSASFVLPNPYTDNSLVSCSRCGEPLNTWAAFRTEALQVPLSRTPSEEARVDPTRPPPVPLSDAAIA
jgi:hypothetical protein